MSDAAATQAMRTWAKRTARGLGPGRCLAPIFWRIPTARTRALARELDFERRRHRHLRRVLGRIREIETTVSAREPTPSDEPPVLLFNTTTSPGWVSFTSQVGLLAGWALRMGGRRVIHAVCHAGMLRCPQGTYRYAPDVRPPCAACRAVKDAVFPAAVRESFEMDDAVRDRVRLGPEAGIEELAGVAHRGIAIGKVCLPSVRHVLRRHTLELDETTTGIYRDFLVSAANLVGRFEELLDRVKPSVAVLFNGVIFPEATAREVARRRGLRTVTYEVGFREQSAFFSHGLAPEFPLDVPGDFRLTDAEERRFDAHLRRRFGGDFAMGGIRFWPEMKPLGEPFESRAARHRQVVPIFTNTVFDTSQVSANTVFGSMFEWLGGTLEAARSYPDTLFVVRAHPDEFRRGVARSAERVGDWLRERGYSGMENLLFIPPTEHVSSYELVGRAKFCVVYNSTIGLEAAVLGVPVLCGGRGKYSGASFVQEFSRPDDYVRRLEEMLAAEEIPWPEAWRDEARRFFGYLLFRASLDLSALVVPCEDGGTAFGAFEADALGPGGTHELDLIRDGITEGKGFCDA
jgi:hypothetical protein